MIMTTPDEFLQFAKGMGLERIKSSSPAITRPISTNNGCTTTGLSVLNNLCRLIEQIHQLKAENDHLRAHLDLVNHVEKFQQRILLKDTHANHKEMSGTLSPSNSFKIKHSTYHQEQKANLHKELATILPMDSESSELLENNSSQSPALTRNNWTKVRHALKFSLRRKADTPASPLLTHVERPIPTISISIESDDDHLQDNKSWKKKKKKLLLTNETARHTVLAEDTDQDDVSVQFVRTYHKRGLHRNETENSSSAERHDAPSANVPSNPDDEALLTRKQSKIARYRRKIRSKFDTVKRQFSDQTSSSSIRLFNTSTYDDIGSGLNHAFLTSHLAPALTKSYQQKMREWETIQKSDFLVNYRRKSITPKMDLTSTSRKSSMSLPANETPIDATHSSFPSNDYATAETNLNLDSETNLPALGPILSPNQRSLIVHQWHEIMSEEISLRHHREYLQKQMCLLNELETNLKSLKTTIFCTNHTIKQQSMIDIKQNTRPEPSYLPRRCRSLHSSVTMPASWILAVQSAAYSDMLDGTSSKTTERAILFNKHFFDQLEHLKKDRQQFERNSIKDLQLLDHLKAHPKRRPRSRVQFILTRAALRKLSLISSAEFPQYFLPDPIFPLQTTFAPVHVTSSTIELLPSTTSQDTHLFVSANNLNKRSKRSRFDLRKTFQRSKSICMTQINSWLQRRRQQQSPNQRRQSATDSNVLTPCSTPKLLGSPRLARLRQKLFRQQTPPAPCRPEVIDTLDDSDNRSQYDLPVRIYFPPSTAPVSGLTESNTLISNGDNQNDQTCNLQTPVTNRRYSSSSSSSSWMKPTAKERRESFATLSNMLNNRYL